MTQENFLEHQNFFKMLGFYVITDANQFLPFP